ncbi:MAG: 23S rRNA (adenine(2503)-C(2))-methyltransferase RlmN [Deltaproteobacteria bacterium]|nr:MAG: 23S rRNA (adenine(2503)-C(2))-methyltransferase RlmN [Deltaproteobacteria bacterium]
MLPLFTLTSDAFISAVRRFGIDRFQAARIYRALLHQGCRNLETAGGIKLSADTRRRLDASVVRCTGNITRQAEEKALLKFATRLKDNAVIESVILPMHSHETLCVSSQAGCRMGCVFCETGASGLIRSLDTSEIVEQVYAARFLLKRPVRNLVFMGMGEPLDNLDAVLAAIRVLNDPRGFDIPLRRMTLSTCGLIPGIRELNRPELKNLNLAVSLNAPTDALRSQLMPVNRKYSLLDLKDALKAHPTGRSGQIILEYVLLKDVNDTPEHAHGLIRFAQGLPANVNLIPFNPGPSSAYAAPGPHVIAAFRHALVRAGIFVRQRASQGRGVGAGCGQLSTRHASS